jgi:hypothetical protein
LIKEYKRLVQEEGYSDEKAIRSLEKTRNGWTLVSLYTKIRNAVTERRRNAGIILRSTTKKKTKIIADKKKSKRSVRHKTKT